MWILILQGDINFAVGSRGRRVLSGGESFEQILTCNKKGKGRTIKSCDSFGYHVDIYAQSTSSMGREYAKLYRDKKELG